MLSDQEQKTVDSYNAVADEWVTTLSKDFWLGEYKRFQQFLPAGKIIDLGCGNGRDIEWFEAHGYDCTGIDISEALIKLAKAKGLSAKFFVKSFYELDFPSGSFDGFWAANSLIHVPREKIQGVLDKIKKIVKPHGIGLITVKEGSGHRFKEWRQSGHKRFFEYYSKEEFESYLAKTGFKVLESNKRTEDKFTTQDATYIVFYVESI